MNKQFSKLTLTLLLLTGMIYLVSCGDDDTDGPAPVEPPFASFTSSIDETNTLQVTFTNNSLDGEMFTWDFGDNTGTSTEESPTYTYTASGTYTVTLTVTNESGTDSFDGTVTVSGFGPNLVVDGEMDSDTGWTRLPIWTGDDNGTDHRVVDGVFRFQNGEDGAGGRFQWSNYAIFQEIAVEAGSTYQFSADVSSTSGTLATWFELYLVKEAPVNEDNIGGDATQLAIKSFGDGENCTASAFSGDIIEIAKTCSAVNDFSKLIGDNGQITFTADDLSGNGTIFLVFKAGSGFPPEGETAGFNDGIDLDNVVIKKVL
ncbi:MAG: PKD domain-containing protein [Bacteroidota bacterium]